MVHFRCRTWHYGVTFDFVGRSAFSFSRRGLRSYASFNNGTYPLWRRSVGVQQGGGGVVRKRARLNGKVWPVGPSRICSVRSSSFSQHMGNPSKLALRLHQHVGCWIFVQGFYGVLLLNYWVTCCTYLNGCTSESVWKLNSLRSTSNRKWRNLSYENGEWKSPIQWK